MDKAAERKGQTQETPVTPVRSAKDVINAMYAQDADKRLSNYLASSAQEIINAGGRGGAKSAANLHRGSIQHQMESARPSASGMLRAAKAAPKPQPKDTTTSMDPLARRSTSTTTVKRRVTTRPAASNATAAPVIKTSLKLAPKRKAPVAMPASARSGMRLRSSDGMINNTKGQTALAKALSGRRATSTTRPAQPMQMAPAAEVEESVRLMQQATRQVLGQPEPVSVKRATPRPKRRSARGLMQDVVRAARPASNNPMTQAANEYPADSVRHRFQTAPKEFVAEPTVQKDAYVGFDDFGDIPPDELKEEQTINSKPPVDIYGMMDEEPVGSAVNLGVVEDYNPQGDTVSGGIKEQKVAQGSGKVAPDNHKYALGGQSPFFLKSVSVEKRPLSDGPKKGTATAPEGTLYERPSAEPIGKKNVYSKKTEPKTAIPTKPTVIIPASRRSKAPLICLLILTVVLGAAVGAFIYLCFFQYME